MSLMLTTPASSPDSASIDEERLLILARASAADTRGTRSALAGADDEAAMQRAAAQHRSRGTRARGARSAARDGRARFNLAFALVRAESQGSSSTLSCFVTAKSDCSTFERQRHRARDVDRRIGADDDADDQRHGEAPERVAAEEHQREQHEQARDARHQRARQRLVHRRVDDRLRRAAAHEPEIVANSVVDDDRVVDRVAEHGEDRAEHREVERASRRARRCPS